MVPVAAFVVRGDIDDVALSLPVRNTTLLLAAPAADGRDWVWCGSKVDDHTFEEVLLIVIYVVVADFGKVLIMQKAAASIISTTVANSIDPK
jgi:hypothetical protein